MTGTREQVKPVHAAPVHGESGRTIRMKNICRQPIWSQAHADPPRPCPRKASAISARKTAEHIVEGVVFLDDENNVLDGAPRHSKTGSRSALHAKCGVGIAGRASRLHSQPAQKNAERGTDKGQMQPAGPHA
ncbi:MAG: hypothetical protein PVSMB7_14830 [Chloroflexota bacterium]